MKESKYVRMAKMILQILKHSRIPLFRYRKSNYHIYTVWQQHVILLAIRQYEGRKSYHGMFADWLMEACCLMRMFIQLSKIPHFTTLQKFADKITGTILERIISNFILMLTDVKQVLFLGTDSTGFKPTNNQRIPVLHLQSQA
jgi:hypothetical protein